MSYQLLVIDSSPSIHKAIRMAFPKDEFDIIGFFSGQEVLNSLNHLHPDLILLNISLRDASGYEIGHFLRSQKPIRGVPLILLKGVFDVVSNDRAQELGCDMILSEPLNSRELIGTARLFFSGGAVPESLPEDPDVQGEEFSSENREEEKRDREKIRIITGRVLQEVREWLESSGIDIRETDRKKEDHLK